MLVLKSAPTTQVYAGDIVVLKASDKLVSFEDAKAKEQRYAFSFFGRLEGLTSEAGETDARSIRIWLRGPWTEEAAEAFRTTVIAGATFGAEGKLRLSKPNDDGKQWPTLDVDVDLDPAPADEDADKSHAELTADALELPFS